MCIPILSLTCGHVNRRKFQKCGIIIVLMSKIVSAATDKVSLKSFMISSLKPSSDHEDGACHGPSLFEYPWQYPLSGDWILIVAADCGSRAGDGGMEDGSGWDKNCSCAEFYEIQFSCSSDSSKYGEIKLIIWIKRLLIIVLIRFEVN